MDPSQQHRPPERERRLRYFWVPDYMVAGLLWHLSRQVASGARRLSLPTVEGPPPDAVLVDVRASWERKCFGFLFRHPSFPVVPDGEIIPDAPGAYAAREVTIVVAPADDAADPAHLRMKAVEG